MRKLLFGGLILLAILLLGGFATKWVLTGYLTPDFLVSQIERQWNCRAHIDDVDVHLLGAAAVEIQGLTIAPRDEHSKPGKALKDRPALDAAAAELRGERVWLEIRPMELIGRKLNIRQLTVTGLNVATRIDRDGNTSIERLFEPAPKKEDNAEVSLATSDEPTTKDPVFSAVAERIEIQNARADFTLEASGNTVRIEDFQLAFTDIDIDPASLASHNRALFQFGGELAVVPKVSPDNREHFRGRVSGTGEATPYDVTSGRLDPVWASDLTIHQGAQIDTFPVIERLQELLEKVDTAGVDFKDLQLRGTLLADAQTRIGQAGGKYTFEKALTLPLPDTMLVVNEGGWIDSGESEHELAGRVVASEELTKKIAGKVDAYIAKKAKGLLGGNASQLVLGPLMDEGRLSIQFTSKGDLSKPKADIVTPFGNASELLDTGKETLKTLEDVGKSLLKGLFGN